MANPNPVQTEKFKAKRLKPLSPVEGRLASRATQIRLPQSVAAAIDALPRVERVRWLREVLTNAARKDLMRHEDLFGVESSSTTADF